MSNAKATAKRKLTNSKSRKTPETISTTRAGTSSAPVPSNPIPLTGIAATLAERGARYGKFSEHARIAQGLQHEMEEFRIYTQSEDFTSCRHPWRELHPVMQRALTTIADKIARILNGDPLYKDNWHDIQGYAKLVEDWITENELDR